MIVARDPGGLSKTFNVEVARQKTMTGPLIFAALINSVDMQGELPEEMTAELSMKIDVEGHEPIILKDTYSGPSFSGGRAAQGTVQRRSDECGQPVAQQPDTSRFEDSRGWSARRTFCPAARQRTSKVSSRVRTPTRPGRDREKRERHFVTALPGSALGEARCYHSISPPTCPRGPIHRDRSATTVHEHTCLRNATRQPQPRTLSAGSRSRLFEAPQDAC